MIAVVCRRAAFYDWQQEIATLQLASDWETLAIEDVDLDTLFKRPTFILVSDGMLKNPEIIAALQSLINLKYLGALLIDEGYLYCNPASQRSIAVNKISRLIPTVVVSGSIMPARDLTQIYGQAVAANKNKRVAPTLTKFRQEYQKGISGNFFSYYPKPGAYRAIMEKMAPFTSLYMPLKNERERVESILRVAPNQTQKDYLLELKKTMAVEGYFETNSVLTCIQRGQQISNGWLKGKDGDVRYFQSSKVDRAVALVQEILASDEKQLVIWCAYREDIKRLRFALDAEGGGKTPQIATLQSGERFDAEGWHAKKYAICLATEASGSSINHFAQCPNAIYFSQDFKWLNLQQSQGRTDRVSSAHPVCYYTFLHTDKTPDARVFYTVRGAAASERSFIKQFDVLSWMGEI